MANSRESPRVFVLGIAYVFIVLVAVVAAQETIYDVTKYDAKADGQTDDAMALIQAWRAACDSTSPARVLVPAGKEFTVGEAVFTGPCKAPPPITFEIQGNLSAISDPSTYTNGVWMLFDEIDGLEVTGGGYINAHGSEVWQYADAQNHLAVSMILQQVSNGKLMNLNFIDAMGFHTKVTDSHDVIVTNLTITAPGKSPNTDGIHLSNATNINITDMVIGTGDDCVSIGAGAVNVLVTRVFCGPGHGLSIGSLGKRPDETSVDKITVINCTLNGTTNGARIKSYHNSPTLTATNIVFQDLVMTQVKNPIIIDQHYDSKTKPQQSNVKISDSKFVNIKGTTISPVIVRLNCSSTNPCENIELSEIEFTAFDPTIKKLATLSNLCANAKFTVTGNINPAAPTC